MLQYDEDTVNYIKECLLKEEHKPSGMFGSWAYYAKKAKEYNKLKEQKEK